MVVRKYEDKQSQENYIENMALLVWQEHIIRIDKKKNVIIIGVEMDGTDYGKEINLETFKSGFGEIIPFRGEYSVFYDKVNEVIKELAKEIIKGRETKETKEYKDFIKK